MASDDWYRCTVWDDESSAEFERRLARVTGFAAAQSLRIQGLTLLESGEREAGTALLERLFADLPEQYGEIAAAHAHLADDFRAYGNTAATIDQLRLSVAANRRATNGRWHGAEIELAVLLAADGTGKDDAEATALLDALDSDVGLRPFIARTQIASRGTDHDLTAAYARGVLACLPEGTPELDRLHAAFLVLAEHGDAEAVSPLVDEFRDVDGTVRWTWQLVRQLHTAPRRGEALPDEPQRLIAACQRELREAGFKVFDLERWSVREVSGAREAARAATLLIRWFADHEDPELQGAVARTLGDKRVRAIAAQPMLDAFAALRSPDIAAPGPPPNEAVARQRRLKDRIGHAVSVLARDPQFDQVAAIVRDPRHGGDRVYLFWALGYFKDPRAVDLCLELLDDPEIGMSALYALSNIKSIRARPTLATLAAQPVPPHSRKPLDFDVAPDPADRLRNQVRVAKKALAKLDRAIASGKAKP